MNLFVFGLGYSGGFIARELARRGDKVIGTGHGGRIAFCDNPAVAAALRAANHILSCVPSDEGGADPVLARYGSLLEGRWLGYLSSTGVYGDTGGAWVDERTPVRGGRGAARTMADAAWLARGARVFRLSGIYGPGRSVLDRLRAGKVQRVVTPNHVFSRIHVADIAGGIAAAAAADVPPGAWNRADDEPCGQEAVILHAARLLNCAPPPALPLDQAMLSPTAGLLCREPPSRERAAQACLRLAATLSQLSRRVDGAALNDVRRRHAARP